MSFIAIITPNDANMLSSINKRNWNPINVDWVHVHLMADILGMGFAAESHQFCLVGCKSHMPLLTIVKSKSEEKLEVMEVVRD